MRPHLGGPPRQCLRAVGCLLGLDCFLGGGARPRLCMKVGSFAWLFVVESALRFLVLCLLLIFHLYSNTCPAKRVSPNTSGTRLVVKAYVSKDYLFLPQFK